jgi:hypothetical protein
VPTVTISRSRCPPGGTDVHASHRHDTPARPPEDRRGSQGAGIRRDVRPRRSDHRPGRCDDPAGRPAEIDEAIAIANATQYGLTSYIQTNNLRRAHRVAEQLAAAGTMINGAPNIHSRRAFGGLGISGFGKEGGPEGLAEFLRVKTVAIA